MTYTHTESAPLCGAGNVENLGKIVRIGSIILNGADVTIGDKVEITETDGSGAVKAVFSVGATTDTVGATYHGEGIRVKDPYVKITKAGSGTLTATVVTA